MQKKSLSYLEKAKVYETFDPYLFDLGIVTTSIDYYDSNFVDISIVRICDISKAQKEIEKNKKELTEVFIQIWEANGGSFDFEKWGNGIYLGFPVHCIQERYICRLIRTHAKEIEEKISRLLPRNLIPEYFFCRSSSYTEGGSTPAGYNIVFEDPETLKLSDENAKDIIISESLKILRKHDTENLLKEEYFGADFFDTTTPNLYGLARQD